MIICSLVAGECMPPLKMPGFHNSMYDCLHTGYIESKNKLETERKLLLRLMLRIKKIVKLVSSLPFVVLLRFFFYFEGAGGRL